MKTTRKLEPVTQTAEERKRERRFTRRMMLLAMSGCIVGVAVQAVTHLAGTPPSPPPPPGLPPPPQLAEPPSVPGGPRPPRLRGK